MAKIASLSSRGVRCKLVIAVCLMSVIPLLVCLNYIFPSAFAGLFARANLSFIFFLLFTMVGLGTIIIKQILDPVVKLSKNARLIAEGKMEKSVDIQSEDEVGQLGRALNQLTLKIKENMQELKDYGSQTAKINLEIQKRIVMMSSLLQISGLITQGEKLDDILRLCAQKLKGIADARLSFIMFLEDGLFTLKAQDGLSEEAARKTVFSEHNECVIRIFENGHATQIDAKNPRSSCQRFLSVLGINNFLGMPISSCGKPIAVVGIGNTAVEFTYSREDVELLDVFVKQITIAVENNLLARRLEKLEIQDALTGLYNEHYIRTRLEEEIRRSILYQRPCGFVRITIDGFSLFQEAYGPIASEAAFKKIAACLSAAFSGVECIGRFGDYEFAVILPERNKRQAEKTAGELKTKVGYLFQDEPQPNKRLSISCVVAENPLDGVSAQELISFAIKARK